MIVLNINDLKVFSSKSEEVNEAINTAPFKKFSADFGKLLLKWKFALKSPTGEFQFEKHELEASVNMFNALELGEVAEELKTYIEED